MWRKCQINEVVTCFTTSFERDEYHEFCNWKLLCETNKGALKPTRKHLS